MRRILPLSLFIFLFFSLEAARAATQTLISGTVQAGSSSVNSGWVELVGAAGTPYAGAEIQSGSYTITRDSSDSSWTNGSYTLKVYPDTSAYGQYRMTTTAVNIIPGTPANQNVNLASVQKQISVTVTDEDGSPVQGEVQFSASGGGGGMSFVQGLNAQGKASYTTNPQGAPYFVTVRNCPSNSTTCYAWYSDAEPAKVYFSLPDDQSETQEVAVSVNSTTSTITGTLSYQGTTFAGYVDFYNADHLFRGWADTNGAFTIYAVPGVYSVDLLPQASQTNMDVVRYYIADSSFVITEGANNLGTLEASYESSNITASVEDINGVSIGSAAAGMILNFWLSNGGEWRKIQIMPGMEGSTGSEAHPGTYRVSLSDPNQNYFPVEASQEATVDGENQEKQVIFHVVPSDATISVSFVKPDGARAADFNSYLQCWSEGLGWGNGGEISRGSGTLKLLAGTYECTAVTPKNAAFSLSPMALTVAQGQNQSVAGTLIAHDAVLSGTITDQNGTALSEGDDPMKMVLESETYGRFEVDVNTDSSWSAELPADTYTLDPSGGDIVPVLGKEKSTVVLDAGATLADQNVETFVTDSTISATVLSPDGSTPLPFAPVTCSYLPDGTKGDFEGGRIIEITAETDANGNVDVPVVSQDGDIELSYSCGVSASEDQGYITPAVQENLTPGESLEFSVFEPDSTIAVSYDAPEGVDLSGTQCQAWLEGGTGMVTAVDDDGDGAVNLEVSQEAGKNWNVSCSGASGDAWYTPENSQVVEIKAAGEVETAVSFEENTVAVPDATSLVFDGTSERSVTLDSVNLKIPSNAIPTTGDATITVTPTPTDIPKTEDNMVLGIPVNISAFDSNGAQKPNLTQEVTVTLPYNQSEVDSLGILETDLVPKYFDESGGTWKVMGGFTVNTEANTITFATDHFTQFSILYNARIAGNPPSKVKNVSVVKKSIKTKTAKITWKKIKNIASYQLQVRKKNNDLVKVFNGLTKTSHVIPKKWLKSNKKYKVRVRAIGENSLYGTWSKYANFTTKRKASS